jgi:polysaccharide biosynthesis protein PslG
VTTPRRSTGKRAGKLIAAAALLILAAGFIANLFLIGPLADRPDAPINAASPRTIAFTDVNPYGTSVFLDKEVEDWKVEKTLQMIKQAGIGWVKQEFPWWELEFRKGYFFDDKFNKSSWDKYDHIVEMAQKYNLKIVARLDRTPAWARPAGSNAGAPPTDLNDFGDFVQAFVERYKGRIDFIQIWNEPNLHDEWLEGTPVDPKRYTEMLKIAYQRAKEVDPQIVVLSAPLAMTLENTPDRRNLDDLIYLDEMYKAGAKDYFDIMSANAFGLDQPPDAAADPNKLNFQRVSLLHQIMENYGDGDKSVWLTEYGWNASPADMDLEKLIWKRVTEQQQADWTVQGIETGRKDWPWLGVAFIWYFREVGDVSPAASEYYFAMVNSEFVPRPVYSSVQETAQSLAVAGPGRYEETSPPVQATGNWSLVIDPKASGKTCLVSSSRNSELSLVFQGTDIALIAPKSPSGGILYVTIDGSAGAANALPRDTQGRAFVDLYSPDSQEQVTIPLANGLGKELPTEQHTLRITVAEMHNVASSGNSVAIDGFGIQRERSYLLFSGVAGATGLGMVGLLATSAARRRRR